jgi:hypothetical protein
MPVRIAEIWCGVVVPSVTFSFTTRGVRRIHERCKREGTSWRASTESEYAISLLNEATANGDTDDTVIEEIMSCWQTEASIETLLNGTTRESATASQS